MNSWAVLASSQASVTSRVAAIVAKLSGIKNLHPEVQFDAVGQ